MEQILEKNGNKHAAYDISSKLPEIRLNLTTQKRSSGIRDDENLFCSTPPEHDTNMIKYEPFHTGLSFFPSNIPIDVDHHYNNGSYSQE
jgi:hypothetical protein